MRRTDWAAADGTCALLTPLQFRAVVAGLLAVVAVADVLTTLPVGVLYLLAIALTFWSTDRKLPTVTAAAAAVLLLFGLATSDTKVLPIDFMILMRLGGACIFLGAGWMITRHRRLLEESHDREAVLRTIVDSEPACVKVLGPGCVLMDMNSAGLAMIGADSLEALRGRCVLPLVVERDRADFEAICQAAFRGEPGWLQFELVGLQGRRLWMEMRIAPLRSATGQVTAILGVTADISDRRRADEQLRDSEQRLTQAAAIAGLGFFEHDYEAGSIFWSPGARAIAGVGPSQDVTPEMMVAMIHPEDRERAVSTIARSYDPGGDGAMMLESRIVRPSGEVRHVSVKSQTRFDEAGRPLKTVGTVFDVTERMQAEAQRDRLARRVLEIQENERRAVARDLHDEIGQALSALKLNLLWLKRDGGNDRVVGDSLHIADEVLQQVRDIALSLRPSVLDDLGLGAAVQWYVEQSGARAGIRARCQLAPDLAPASPTTEIACFRVLQEALTNVHRHAGAASAEVWLHDDGQHLELVVRDDGRGFDVHRVIAGAERGSNMGLLSIRERAALLGGMATVTSTPGCGTEVRVRLPLTVAAERLGVGVDV
jgi:two-component system sensor histidine kinase UhpB